MQDSLSDDDPSSDPQLPAGVGFDAPPPPLETLVAEGDVQGLLDLGAAHRVGTPYVAKDAAAAHRCFLAAADLGSEDASYLVAMACFAGSAGAPDPDEGQRRLRVAAQQGHLRAKIYLANMYELGLYGRVDAEKADVWYRSVARGASITAEPESPEYVLEMAELGCVRQCLEVIADETMSAKDRHFYLKKAKAMGYAQFLRQTKREDRRQRAELLERGADAETLRGVRGPADSGSASTETTSAHEDGHPDAQTEASKPRGGEPRGRQSRGAAEPRVAVLGAQWTLGAGLGALLVGVTFATAGLAGGWLAMEGARTLALAGSLPPVFASQPELALYAVAFLLGVPPVTAVVRWRIVLVTAVVGALAGVGSFFLYDQLPVLVSPPLQAAAVALGVFVALAGGLGAVGGTRVPVYPSAPAVTD